LKSAQVQKSAANENFKMLVLHAIMWRRWHRKRWNKCMHLINIKKPEFRIFSHLSWTCSKMKRHFMVFLEWTLSNFSLSQLVGEKIWKQNTNYKRAISPEEQLAIFLRYVL